jgi:DNA-binding NarL/FixJ family response regulator
MPNEYATPDGAGSGESAEKERIRIVLADDHEVVRSGLRLLLERESDFEVVAKASDIESARRYVRGHHPRVLVLDLHMPGGSSLEAIPTIREESPDTQIVVLTMQREPAFAREALGAGALGYVLKEAANSELVEAVRRAAVGESYLTQAGRPHGLRAAPRPAGRSFRARGRGAAADRTRTHQRRDRRTAVPVGADRSRPIARISSRSSGAPPAPSSSATRSSAD